MGRIVMDIVFDFYNIAMDIEDIIYSVFKLTAIIVSGILRWTRSMFGKSINP